MADSPAPLLHLGAAWQPELWTEDQWPLDIARMKEVGITCVRLFEHAWHRFEPREWEFDCEWAVRILDMLRDAGIGAILATPTSSPPAWMTARYPEILQVTPDGRRLAHGRGRHYSVVSSRYREFCTRVIDQMVHAFRGHEAVIGWQVDHRIAGADYGNESRRAFHNWLHERFGHIEGLNKTWGLEFGAQAYEYFEQVPVPAIGNVGNGPIAAGDRHHPSLMIAFQRFINDQWSSFIQAQCETIRSGFEKPISTNMTQNWGMNYFRQNHLLDRVGIALDNDVDLSVSLLHFDRMRAEKPGVPFWLLGAPAGGPLVTPLTWLATLTGGEVALLDQWREPWAGQDMGRGGIVAPTGRWSGNRAAVTELATQLRDHADYLNAHPPDEARLGVILSNESAWAFSVNPPEPEFNYETIWRDEFYRPIAQQHYWRDVIDQNADFCPYHVLVMPLLPMVFRPTKERLKEWVTGGGCLLIGPLTGHRTEEFTAWTDHEFGGLEELMGATCTASFNTHDTGPAKILWGADASPEAAAQSSEAASIPTSTARGLCHAFSPTTAHVLARYQSAGAPGEAALLMNKLGQGTVLTVGARVDADTYLDLIHTLCELAKIEPLATGSPHVAVIPRTNPDNTIAAYGLVNLSSDPQTITLPKGGTNRLTTASVGPEIQLQPLEVMLVELQPQPAPATAEPDAQLNPQTHPPDQTPAPGH